MHKFQEKEIQEKDNITSKSTKCSKFVVAWKFTSMFRAIIRSYILPSLAWLG
jgi:hypothetical protein